MRTFQSQLVASAAVAVICLSMVPPLRAQTEGSVALTGRVTSVEEGPMEVVVVSAKRQGRD